ncbi:MAG: GtrA family protein [Proteobacteria bacterium]|nr:GtrA family protein [Pseudomonadota bacterium]
MNEQAPRAEHALIRLARQFSRFFSVGLVAVAVHYGVMILLVEVFRLDEVHAAVIGYTVGGFASYSLNRKFTYDTERSHAAAAWRFAVVAGIGLIITWAFMALFARYFGWHYVLSQLITTAIVMMWSFFAHKYWTFVDPN